MELFEFGNPIIPSFLLSLVTSLPTARRSFYDSPAVSNVLFRPRRCPRNSNSTFLGRPDLDGLIVVGDGVGVGFRIYPVLKPKAVIIHFHANAELACEVDATPFMQLGCSLMAIDYRGYGWSSGHPSLSQLCPDADKIAEKIPSILSANGLSNLPLILFGRSLGAISATHLAASSTHSSLFSGIVIDSGLMSIKDLHIWGDLEKTIPNLRSIFAELPEPLLCFQNARNIRIPLLVVHGDCDELIPLTHAKRCYDLSPAEVKHLEIVKGGTHNSTSPCDYYHAIRRILPSIFTLVDPEKVKLAGSRSFILANP
jgi:alpha-beta hydrolase superfamily lysophospholipase